MSRTERDKTLSITPFLAEDGTIWQRIETWGGLEIYADSETWAECCLMIEQEFCANLESFFEVLEFNGQLRLVGIIPF